MSSRCPLEVPKTPTVTDKVMKTPAIIDVHGALFDPIGSCLDFTFSSLLGASTLGETASLTTDNNFQEKSSYTAKITERERWIKRFTFLVSFAMHHHPYGQVYSKHRGGLARERMTITRGVKEGQSLPIVRINQTKCVLTNTLSRFRQLFLFSWELRAIVLQLAVSFFLCS